MIIAAPNVSDFIAQLVRALHQYREVMGSNPVESPEFFRLLYTIALIVFITAMIITYLTEITDNNQQISHKSTSEVILITEGLLGLLT